MILFVDGGCINGNPGDAIYWSAALRRRPGGAEEPLIQRQRSSQYRRNNSAEWMALLEGLKALRAATEPSFVTIRSDSQLIVHQFNGEWNCKNDRLRALKQRADGVYRAMEEEGYAINVEWRPRDEIESVLGH